MRIRTKIMFSLIATSLISVILLSSAVFYLTHNTLLKTHGQIMQAIASGQKSNVLHVLNAWQDRVNLISGRTKLRTLLSKEITSPSQEHNNQMRKILNDAINSTQAIKYIKICDLEGNSIVAVGTMPEQHKACIDFLELGLGDTNIRKLWMDRNAHLHSLVTGPVRLNGNLVGMILVVLDAKEILNITQNYDGLGETGETLLAARTPDGNARFLTPLRYKDNDGLERTVSKQKLNVPITQALLKREIVMTSSETIDYDDEPIIAATAYIPELDWGLVSKMNRHEALKSVETLFNTILLITLAIFVIVILLGIYFSRLMTMPIINLVDISQKIKDGNRTLRAEILSQDEVGELAASFNNMLDSLDEATNELEEFSYRTSHDLRSPLRSSLGLLKLIDRSTREDDRKMTFEALDLAQKSLTKLDMLVQDILTLTKIKHEDEEAQPIDVEELVKESLDKLSHMAHFERLDIRNDFRFKDKLTTKNNRLTVIVENLISNAIKYQNLEEENSFIKISTYKSEKFFVFSVSDNGLGVPKDLQEKLFTMFQRLHPKTSFGSGLGLYMIKKSATILGGEIIFEDTGQGANFKLFVPITEAKDVAITERKIT